MAVVLLELAALLQDFQRNRGRRHRQCDPGDHRPAPIDQTDEVGERADCKRGQRQLSGAEAEYGATQRHQPAKLELEPDQEQQHDHAQLRNRDDALGRTECRQPMRTDHDAGDQICDDGGQPESPSDRNAQDGSCKKHQTKRQEAEFAVLHWKFHRGAEVRASECGVGGIPLTRHSPAPARFSNMGLMAGAARARGPA